MRASTYYRFRPFNGQMNICVREGEVMNRAISLRGSARKKWSTDLG